MPQAPAASTKRGPPTAARELGGVWHGYTLHCCVQDNAGSLRSRVALTAHNECTCDSRRSLGDWCRCGGGVMPEACR
jgi:hypothetical protein